MKHPIVGLALLFICGGAVAAPIFFVEPGNDPNDDLAWQATVGSFAEQDFEGYSHGAAVATFQIGGVTVTPSVTTNTGAEIFQSGLFVTPGTVFQKSLLTCNRPVDNACADSITLNFSQAVTGFGTWIFDNSTGSADSFEMTVNGVTSNPLLDANPGDTNHVVEGWLGVYDAVGFTSVTINNAGGTGVFELDHMQISVPAPMPLGLFALGAVLLILGRKVRLVAPLGVSRVN